MNGHQILSLFLTATILCVSGRTSADESTRVSEGLLLLYTFDEGKGTVVKERSGSDDPLDLRIVDPNRVDWRIGAVRIKASTRITSDRPPVGAVRAIRESQELTLEAWVTPQNVEQNGPARIVTLSDGPGARNLTLGQDATAFDARLRTTSTSENGLPSLATPNTVTRDLTHIVLTRDRSGSTRLYVNGEVSGNGQTAGDLSNWDETFPLILGNEKSGDRPWLGELHLVALYHRALDAAEVGRNFAAGCDDRQHWDRLLPAASVQKVDFTQHVQPILRAHCFDCHSGETEEGGLNLGLRLRVFEGGEHGPVLVPGSSLRSPLIHLVAGVDPKRTMPPEGERLSAEEIGILRAWIDQGADWPPGADLPDPRVERAKEHWAFQPLREMEIPAVSEADRWPRTSIDRFVLQSLQHSRLSPRQPLNPRRLIRRVSFDLVGLPPTPEEVDAFLAEWSRDSEAAYERLIDRLLASPHFGERWGRHWLDVARYADSNGQEGDQDRPGAYQYRDFVIRAFNDDMPYDTFVRWQIAGDEYEPSRPEALAATGFLVAGPHTVLEATFLEEERLRNRYNELDDMVSTLGSGLLGLTIGCARCHDHKYDAITAREYYRVLSVFHSGDRREIKLPDGSDALVFRDDGPQPRESWLFRRGDFYDRDQPVQLGFLDVLMSESSVEKFWEQARRETPLSDSTYQRKALAEWITDVDRGAGALLARVIVNRLWQHHFGEGLVRTPNDFGVRGEAPTHPELLEWLAHDLVANGWTLKRLHRQMLLSSTYRQGSTRTDEAAEIDPENRLLWRMNPRRIEAEILRDSMLHANGTLNPKAFGPAFKPPIPAEAMVARNLKTPYKPEEDASPEIRRRSVYMFHKRVVPYPLLQAFDRPDSLQSCGRRDLTTVAPQALALMNDQFVRGQAADFAERLKSECGDDAERSIQRAFLLALGREPSEIEQTASAEFLAQQTARRRERKSADPPREALTDFCQTLFGLNEFFTID